MSRLYATGAALAALLAAFVAGSLWLAHATARARDEGFAAGRADVAQAIETETAAQRGRAEAALAQTNAKVADLERNRDRLQESYDGVLAQVARLPAGGRCLDVGLVRALDALGRGGGDDRARP